LCAEWGGGEEDGGDDESSAGHQCSFSFDNCGLECVPSLGAGIKNGGLNADEADLADAGATSTATDWGPLDGALRAGPTIPANKASSESRLNIDWK
jgi:hypothetical protein